MKVLLVDDHPLVLSALTVVIEALGTDIRVVGVDSPSGARDALTAAEDFDLVLLDLSLGDADGFEVLAELRARWPAVPVVVVSASERASDVIRAIDGGAVGFVPKRSAQAELYEALRMVMLGAMYVPPSMLGLAFAAPQGRSAGRGGAHGAAPLRGGSAEGAVAFAPASPAHPADAAHGANAPNGTNGTNGSTNAAHGANGANGADPAVPPLPETRHKVPSPAQLGLTPRQAEVLSLLLQGLPNKLIARQLNLSVETVKDHVAAVLRALNVGTRTQAVLAISQMTMAQGGTFKWRLPRPGEPPTP